MNLSLGEFRALVAKAFRGAGYSWGFTEEAAFAAGRLASSGLPAGVIVVRLLRAVDGQPMTTLMPGPNWQGDGLCPVCVGTTLADRGGCDAIELGPTFEPVLLTPLLARTIEPSSTHGYKVSWKNGSCVVGAEAADQRTVAVEGDLPAEATAVAIERVDKITNDAPLFRRIDLDEANAAELERFAHRVYAPATEESRASAGPS